MAAVATQASLPSPDLMAQIHFAGAEQISADTNAVAFTNLWCSPEAQALRDQTLGKLSRAPYEWLKSKMLPGTGDGAAQLRPLLDDLLSAEWFLQLRDATNGSPEFALAIRLNAARAQLWNTNLATVLQMWTGIPVVQDQPGNWELKKHQPPNLIRFVHAGDWVVFGCGQDKLPLNDELVRRVLAEKHPVPVEKNEWLTADLDWPRLARWFPSLQTVDLPETRWQAVGRNGNLRLDGRLIFPQPLALTLEKWRVPVDVIHEPIASFTAVRGFASWLEKQNWAQPYEISPGPNQTVRLGADIIPAPDICRRAGSGCQEGAGAVRTKDVRQHRLARSIHDAGRHGDDQRPDFLAGNAIYCADLAGVAWAGR